MQEAINNNYLYSTNDVKTLKEKIKTASGIKNDGDIYYYNGTDVNNNIIFADICWQIVRTTENGGVKLIYNGVPVNGKCTSSVNYIDSSAYNNEANKITSVGYKYGDYDYSSINFYTDSQAASYYGSSTATDFIYGEDATLNSDGHYTLVNAKSFKATNDFKMGLTHKYTCFVPDTNKEYTGTTNYECGDVVYISSYSGLLSGSTAYYVSLPNTVSYKQEDYGSLLKNFDSNSIMISYTVTWAFANSVNYHNANFILENAIEYDMSGWSTDHSFINDTHFTCFRTSGSSCSTLYYIFYSGEGGLYFVKIGEAGLVLSSDVDEYSNGTFTDTILNLNTNDSNVKKVVEQWYETNLFNSKYEKYIVDDIYYNDRSLSDYGGWISTTSTTNLAIFDSYQRTTSDISLNDTNDSFAVASGNQALQYPVGLLSYDEALMAGTTKLKNSYLGKNSFWLMTPYSYEEIKTKDNTDEDTYFYEMKASVYSIDNNGNISSSVVDSTNNVRPVISISDDLKVIGTGTPDDPITLSFAVKYELGSDDVTGVDVPETDYYASGDSVILDTSFVVGNVYNGYVFKGWTTSDVTISDGKFTMPDQDVILTGSWTKVEYITPVIDVSVRYSSNIRIGEYTYFNVSVTNDEDYEITDVYIETSADLLDCSYDSDFSCTIVNDTTLKIASIPAHQTFSTSDVYVEAIKIGKVELEAKVTSASAESAIFDTSKEYKDSDYATTTAGVKICNVLDGEGDGSVYQYYIEKTIKSKMIPVYDEAGDDVESVIIGHWVVLEPNTCTSIALDTSTSDTEVIYTIFQLDKQENTLVKVDGLINSNGGEFSLEPKEYTVTFYNKYVKKKYFHGWDRIENDIEGKLW